MTESAKLPQHIGFILDGNRRWAKAHKLPKFKGHQQGAENLKTIAQACFDRNIGVMSAYIFSTENWQREVKEVDYLMDLAYRIFQRDLKELHSKGIKIVVSGIRDRLSPKIIKAMDESIELTKNNTKGTLNLCFNYGGQQELVDAVKSIVDSGKQSDAITPELIRNSIYHPELPAVDYIVRTSGEQRLSNFLLWDSAYAELKFVDVPWPAFDESQLDEVLADYADRQRRFGGS
jgi:undecaprenyl diphosphate synthase